MIQLKWSVGFICQSIFGWLSMVVYGLLIWTLIKKKKRFHGSYYKLFLFNAILSVIFYINSWPMMRLINNVCKECTFSDFFKQKTFVGLDSLRFLHVYFHHVSICLEILMFINRYTAIANPINYHKLWDKILLPTCAAVLLIPISLSYPTFIYPSFIAYSSVFDAYYYVGTEEQVRRYWTLTSMQGISCLSFVLIGAASLVAMARKVSHPAHHSVEIKLYIHCAIVSVVKLNFFVYGITWLFFREIYNNVNPISVIEYCLLFVQCIDPWVLLFCSRELRRQTPLFRLIPAFRKASLLVNNSVQSI